MDEGPSMTAVILRGHVVIHPYAGGQTGHTDGLGTLGEQSDSNLGAKGPTSRDLIFRAKLSSEKYLNFKLCNVVYSVI